MPIARIALLYYMEDLGWCELKSPVPGVNVGLSQVEEMPPRGVKDIETAKTGLEEQGVKFDGDIRTISGMVKLATLYDLDGNCLMLYQDISLPYDK